MFVTGVQQQAKNTMWNQLIHPRRQLTMGAHSNTRKHTQSAVPVTKQNTVQRALEAAERLTGQPFHRPESEQ